MHRVDKIDKKRSQEERVLDTMISLYCKKNHGVSGDLCEECKELQQYANSRIERCPFMEEKTFCSNCKVHCYTPVMRERIKEVMRFSGPRMLLYYPHLAIWHLVCSMKERKNLNKQ